MKSIFAKSHRLKRYHMMVVIIIISFLVWLMLQYFAMIAASFERVAFENNLRLIARLFQIQQMIKKNNCQDLKNPNLFSGAIEPGLNASSRTDTDKVIEKWRYSPKEQILTYYVHSKRFFRASNQEIHISFICWNGNIFIKVSPHQWCSDMRLWGCVQWEEGGQIMTDLK